MRGGFAQEVLELGEDLLDGVEIRAVGREIFKFRASCLDGIADAGNLVAGEVVENDDVTLVQGGCESLLDPGLEGGAVDGPVEDARGGDAVMPQGGDEGRCFLVSVRGNAFDALASGGPAIAGRHVRRGPCFIKENKLFRLQPRLPLSPFAPGLGEVLARSLGGNRGLFLSVRPSCCR